MNRRGFLKVLALLPAATLPLELPEALPGLLAPLQGPRLVFLTSVGELAFDTPREAWAAQGGVLAFRAGLQFTALQTMTIHGLEVELPGLGRWAIDLRLNTPFVTAGEEVSMVGGQSLVRLT